MAKLVLIKLESHPYNSNGCAWYAYFEGSPTEEELREAQEETEAAKEAKPERCDDEVAKRAGLERWFLGCFV